MYKKAQSIKSLRQLQFNYFINWFFITKYKTKKIVNTAFPAWFDNTIQKATVRHLDKRFETAEEMLVALEHGELKPLQAQRTPLIARARLVKWQWVAIFSIIINILLVYLLVVS